MPGNTKGASSKKSTPNKDLLPGDPKKRVSGFGSYTVISRVSDLPLPIKRITVTDSLGLSPNSTFLAEKVENDTYAILFKF